MIPPLLVLDSCSVDLGRQLVFRRDQTEVLSTKEARLLGYLAARPGRTVGYDELLRNVWDYQGALPLTRPHASVMSRLRWKVEDDPAHPRHLLTATGDGYRFEPSREPTAPPPPAPGRVCVGAVERQHAPLADDVAGRLARRGLTAHASETWEDELADVDRLVLIAPDATGDDAVQEVLDQIHARRLAVDLVVVQTTGRPRPGRVGWAVDGALDDLVERLEHPAPPPRDGGVHPPEDLQPPGAAYASPWYVPRPREEAEAAALLAHPGAPLVLVGSRRVGKSWLAEHVLQTAATPDDRVVRVDLAALGPRVWDDPDALCLYLAWELADAVIPDDPDCVQAAWAGSEPPRRRLDRLVQGRILPETPGRLFLFVDHADRLTPGPRAADFFAMLRGWASRTREPWPSLRLILAISTEPSLLVSTPTLSPFNLAPPVRLERPGPAFTAELARRHGVSAAAATAVRRHTGGHAHLDRIALYRAATRPLAAADLDEPTMLALLDDHLRSRLVALRASDRLADAVRAVLRGEAGALDYLDAHRLVAAGLLARDASGGLRFQVPLLEAFLRDRL